MGNVAVHCQKNERGKMATCEDENCREALKHLIWIRNNIQKKSKAMLYGGNRVVRRQWGRKGKMEKMQDVKM